MGERVLCRNPVSDKQPTRIERWKFDRVREALLDLIPEAEPGLEFSGLSAKVNSFLGAEEAARLGSLGWYVTVVKLELEVRGEIKRLPGKGRQRLVRIR